jgi:hypothetical protein
MLKKLEDGGCGFIYPQQTQDRDIDANYGDDQQHTLTRLIKRHLIS